MKIAPRLSRSGPRRSGRLRVGFLVLNLDGMGGTSRSAITQANALARRGHVDVRMLSVTRSADAPHYAIDPAVAVEHLVDVRGDDPLHRQPSRLVPRRWDSQFSALTDVGLERALPDLDVDVLVTVTPALMATAIMLVRREVAVVHQEHRSSADRVGGMEPLLAFAPRAAAVALLTESTASWLRAELGATAPELVVMPNPLPIAPQPRSPLDSRTIVSAGRIVAEKQFIHLVRAFEQVADDAPGWRLRILGDGPLREELARPRRQGRSRRPGRAARRGPGHGSRMGPRVRVRDVVEDGGLPAGRAGGHVGGGARRDLRLPLGPSRARRGRGLGVARRRRRQGRARRRAPPGHHRRRTARAARPGRPRRVAALRRGRDRGPVGVAVPAGRRGSSEGFAGGLPG